jgi:hypothetical protein
MTTTSMDASLNSPGLAIVVYRKEHFAPADDVYVENPMGAFRGVAFALIFNVILGLTGVAAWGLWQMLK